MIRLIDIEKAVCQVFEITPDQLKKKGQKRDEFTPRHLAMLVARELTIYSYDAIGGYFGGYRNDVAIHAIKSISNNIETDERLKEVYDDVCKLAKKLSQRDAVKEAIVSDLNAMMRRIGSGNISHSKLALGQIILNIETLL